MTYISKKYFSPGTKKKIPGLVNSVVSQIVYDCRQKCVNFFKKSLFASKACEFLKKSLFASKAREFLKKNPRICNFFPGYEIVPTFEM